MNKKWVGLVGIIGSLFCASLSSSQTLDQRYMGLYNPFSTDGTTCSQATLAAASGNSASAGKAILMSPTDVSRANCNWGITSNLSVALPRRLYVPPGANINISPGVTLTACIDAGDYQIFGGAGNVVTPSNCGSAINASWWPKTQAGLTLADQAATASNVKMILKNGTWAISSGTTLTSLYQVDPGAVISVGSAVTLTSNTCPDAGVYKIFTADNSTTGLVTFPQKACGKYQLEWWTGIADNSTDQTANIHSAVAGIPKGSELHVNPGIHKHGALTFNKVVTLSGETWSVYHRSPFAASQWDDITKTFRTSLRCTATTGTCYTFNDPSDTGAYGIKNLMLVGNGTGTADGVVIGGLLTETGLILSKIENVAVANFGGNCFRQEYSNEATVHGLALMGCNGDGLVISEQGGNNNWYRDLNISNVGGDGIECTLGARILIDGFAIQGVGGNGIKNNGCSQMTYSNGYMEGTHGAINHVSGARGIYTGINNSPGTFAANHVTIAAGDAVLQDVRNFGTPVTLTVESGATVELIRTTFTLPFVDNNTNGGIIDHGIFNGVQVQASLLLDVGLPADRFIVIDSNGASLTTTPRLLFKETGGNNVYLWGVTDSLGAKGFNVIVTGSTRERIIYRDSNDLNALEEDLSTGIRYVTKDADAHASSGRLANGVGYAQYRKQSGDETDVMVLSHYKKSDGTIICTWYTLDGTTKNGADFANSVVLKQGACP